MKAFRIIALLFLSGILFEKAQGDPTGKPDARLAGLWKTISIVEQGKEKPYPNSGSVYYLFKEDGTVDITTGASAHKTTVTWKYKTDTASVPCRISLLNKEGDITRRCLYRLPAPNRLELLGDQVNLNAEYPKDFGAGLDEGLLVFQQVQKIE